MPETDSLVSLRDTCQQLGGISRPTLYKLLQAEELRSVPIGRRRFIPQSQINRYIEQRQAGSGHPGAA